MKKILYLFGALLVLMALAIAPVLGAVPGSQSTQTVQTVITNSQETTVTTLVSTQDQPALNIEVIPIVSTKQLVAYDSYFYNHHKHLNKYSNVKVHVTQN